MKISEKMWGKKVIHIPNTQDLLNHDSADDLLVKYISRTLCLISSEHKVFMTKSSEKSTLEWVEYYNKIGFSHISKDNFRFVKCDKNKFLLSSVLLSNNYDIEEFQDDSYTAIVPFVSSKDIQALCTLNNKKLKLSLALSNVLNDKCQFRGMLKNKGILAPGANQISVYQEGYRGCAIRIFNELKADGIDKFAVIFPESSSGFGIRRFDNENELSIILDNLDDDIKYFLIDPWYSDNIGAPAFQFYLGDTKEDDICLGLSDQMLDGTAHLGNSSPSIFEGYQEVKDLMEQVKEFLRDFGARGLMGVDFLIRKIHGKIVPYVLEVNARQTGAVYAGLLAYEIRGHVCKPWLGYNHVEVPNSLSIEKYHKYLMNQNIDYKVGDTEGVIVISNGNVSCGKMMVLILADEKERLDELLKISRNYKE